MLFGPGMSNDILVIAEVAWIIVLSHTFRIVTSNEYTRDTTAISAYATETVTDIVIGVGLAL